MNFFFFQSKNLALVFIVENLKFWIFLFVVVGFFFFGFVRGPSPPQECWALLALPIKERETHTHTLTWEQCSFGPTSLKNISPSVIIRLKVMSLKKYIVGIIFAKNWSETKLVWS